MALRVSRLRLDNTTSTAAVALRVSRLSAATSSTATTPVAAGSRLVDIEPYSTVSLVGTGSSAGSWTQVAGSTVALSGSGASLTYVAPANASGVVLRFTYTVSGQSSTVEHVVLPATELISIGGSLQPVRWLTTSEMR